MRTFKNLLMGIVAGVGGVAPGLSGSVLMVLMGIYEQTLEALGSIFTDFKKKITFLAPLLLGMLIGVLLFSKVVDYLLVTYELATRYAFFGLVLGTLPLFFYQTQKRGFRKRYYLLMAVSVAAGIFLFGTHTALFPTVTEPTFLQSALMGLIVGFSSIVPGVDSSVILASIGYYEIYVSALADLNLRILLPELLGLAVGAIAVSAGLNQLLKRWYSVTFSVLFGLFISMIPGMLNEKCVITSVSDALTALICTVAGFALSYYLADASRLNAKIKTIFSRGKKK